MRSIVFLTLLCLPVLSAQTAPERLPKEAVVNRSPLAPSAFYPLPLGQVKPAGWLKHQLEIQASGLSGHLDEFWPDLSSKSAWLGGPGEGWERGPYYLDGLVPLAYLLDDPALIAKARKWVNWTLENQRPDGSIGPEKNKDWWPNMIMLKVLTQYQEATGDARVIPLMERYFAYQARQMSSTPLKEWAIYRWGDEVLSILWLYNRNGDPKLLDLARMLSQQGFDWKALFADYPYRDKVSKADSNLKTHLVNNTMALKTAAVWSLLSGSPDDRAASMKMLEMLDQHHGLPNGMPSGDEHLAGRDPSQGTELCAVVEEMFSLEVLTGILGNATLPERLERIAFNALPATFSKDMWAHQYDQQPNQVLVTRAIRDWTTNGNDSNLFGLEPNFGCCTANMHQGWPKFTSSLWMATPDKGLAAVAYSPSDVRTTVRDTAVHIAEETNYPFSDEITLKLETGKRIDFPLLLRIPRWCPSPQIKVNGASQRNVHAGTFFPISREWKTGDVVQIRFSMPVLVSHGFNNGVHVSRGPLLFSLAIGEKWKKLADKGQTADWEVYPSTPWNYALAIKKDNPQSSFQLQIRKAGEQPFSADGTPVRLTVDGVRVKDWTLVDNSAGPVPRSPLGLNGHFEKLTLIPYGAAKLRITDFPTVER